MLMMNAGAGPAYHKTLPDWIGRLNQDICTLQQEIPYRFQQSGGLAMELPQVRSIMQVEKLSVSGGVPREPL